jgi:hypothetical protein
VKESDDQAPAGFVNAGFEAAGREPASGQPSAVSYQLSDQRFCREKAQKAQGNLAIRAVLHRPD